MNLELLKSERKAKGYTQKYMAEQLGFKDRSSYCLIENGKCSVDIELANRIASVLDLSERRTFEIFFASKVQVSSTQLKFSRNGGKNKWEQINKQYYLENEKMIEKKTLKKYIQYGSNKGINIKIGG